MPHPLHMFYGNLAQLGKKSNSVIRSRSVMVKNWCNVLINMNNNELSIEVCKIYCVTGNRTSQGQGNRKRNSSADLIEVNTHTSYHVCVINISEKRNKSDSVLWHIEPQHTQKEIQKATWQHENAIKTSKTQ